MTVYATSTIPAVKAELVTRFAARAGLAGVQVSYGWPKGNPQKELLIVGGAIGEQQWGPFGRFAKDEIYDLKIIVSVVFADGEQQNATERAFAIVAEIEQELRNAPNLGNTVQGVIDIRGNFELSENMLGGLDREAYIEFSVHVKARI